MGLIQGISSLTIRAVLIAKIKCQSRFIRRSPRACQGLFCSGIRGKRIKMLWTTTTKASTTQGIVDNSTIRRMYDLVLIAQSKCRTLDCGWVVARSAWVAGGGWRVARPVISLKLTTSREPIDPSVAATFEKGGGYWPPPLIPLTLAYSPMIC